MPAKIMASRTEMNVKSAENVATLDRASNVRGSEQIHETIPVTTEKTIVQVPWLLMVLSHSAPIKMCTPCN